MLGIIFRKSQNKIQDPAKLKRLIMLINDKTWMGLDIDVKGNKLREIVIDSLKKQDYMKN